MKDESQKKFEQDRNEETLTGAGADRRDRQNSRARVSDMSAGVPPGRDRDAIASGRDRADARVLGRRDLIRSAGLVAASTLGGAGALSTSAAAFEGGSGSESDPYQVGTLNQLDSIRDDLSAHYELVADIDASPTADWNTGDGWDPIGDTDDNTYKTVFTGSLDGQGHTITGLQINAGTDYARGLFGELEDGADVRSLTIENADYNCDPTYAGAVAGTATDSALTNISVVDCDVDTQSVVGGVVAWAQNTIAENIEVIRPSLYGSGAGGVFFELDTYGTGNETSSLELCRVTDPIIESSSMEAGGLTGVVSGDAELIFRQCMVLGGSVLATADAAGGLIGQPATTMDSFVVADSASTADVDGSSEEGGVFGLWWGESSSDIQRVYAAGSVSGTADKSGGVYGDYAYSDSELVAYKNVYWDEEATGQSTQGQGTQLEGAVSLTTDEMTGDASVDNLEGFDFEQTWGPTDAYPKVVAITDAEPVEPIMFDQKFRVVDFTDGVFDPSVSQVSVEPVDGGDQLTDQFGPENRATLTVEHLGRYEVQVSNQSGDIYHAGEMVFFAPSDLTYEGENVEGTIDTDVPRTIYISQQAVGNDEDGPGYIDVPGVPDDPGGIISPPPVAIFDVDPIAPIVDETVTLDASGSSAFGSEIVEYNWQIDGETISGNDAVIDRSFSSPGVVDLELEVVDENDGVGTWSMGIYVAEDSGSTKEPPTADMWILPEAQAVGELVKFDAGSSVGVSGEIVEYRWQIGDVERTGETVDETFNGAGIKEVELTVVDEHGLYASERSEVVIYKEVDEESATAGPMAPLDGVRANSIRGAGWLLVGAAAAAVGAHAIDQRTEITVPTWVKATPVAGFAFMMVETVAPGAITMPIMAALDVVGPLILLAGVLVVLWLVRGWRDRRAADRINSLRG